MAGGFLGGLLDDENGLLGGIAAGIESGVDAYGKAEDRAYDRKVKTEQAAYNRKVMAAKLKAAEAEALRKRDDDDIAAAKAGYRVERDSKTGLVRRDETGRAMISADPTLTPAPKPLHPLQEQLYKGQLEAMGQKPVMERNKIMQDAAEKGFKADFDESGRLILTPTKEKIAADQARLELLKAQAGAARKKGAKGAGGGKKGKELPVGKASEFGSSQAAFQALDDALNIADLNPEYFNPSKDLLGKATNMAQSAAGALGMGDTGEKANAIDADLMMKAQVIGRYLEDGKLAEGDAKRYAKMLPARGDSRGVVQSKTESLKRMIYQKMTSELNALEAAGYNAGTIARPGEQKGPGLLQGKQGLIGNKPQGLIPTQPQAPANPNAPLVIQEIPGAKVDAKQKAAIQWVKDNPTDERAKLWVDRLRKEGVLR